MFGDGISRRDEMIFARNAACCTKTPIGDGNACFSPLVKASEQYSDENECSVC